MLHNHPVTSFLYRHGYDGIQDIYEFWNINKEALKTTFRQTHNDDETSELIEQFEQIVRWHSVYGLFFRFEVANELSKSHSYRKKIDEVYITSGGFKTAILDYSTRTQVYDKTDNLSDLRGFSIVGKEIRDIDIEHINFDYGYFDFSTFENVRFRNCTFKRSSFIRTRFINCTFDSDCVLIKNDFSNAVISATFHCPINDPTILPMKVWFISKLNAWYYFKYPRFTILLDDSFVSQTDNPSIHLEYQKQESLRNLIHYS